MTGDGGGEELSCTPPLPLGWKPTALTPVLAGTPLGDPIEVGALAAVLKRPQTQTLQAVELAAAKSWVGHGETAAGAIGLLRSASRLQQHQRAAILHLRQLNAYVTGALDDTSTLFVAGRQCSPGTSTSTQGAASVGISAFAFQGTNAHAILSSLARERGSEQLQEGPGPTAVLGWQRRRIWYVPPVHQLLFRVVAAGGGQVAYDMALGRPSLAYIWHHPVRGGRCLGASHARTRVLSLSMVLPSAAGARPRAGASGCNAGGGTGCCPNARR